MRKIKKIEIKTHSQVKLKKNILWNFKFSYENISLLFVLFDFSYGYTSAYSEQTSSKELHQKVLCEFVKYEWINKPKNKEDAKGQ